jgi:hypothetical protein
MFCSSCVYSVAGVESTIVTLSGVIFAGFPFIPVLRHYCCEQVTEGMGVLAEQKQAERVGDGSRVFVYNHFNTWIGKSPYQELTMAHALREVHSSVLRSTECKNVVNWNVNCRCSAGWLPHRPRWQVAPLLSAGILMSGSFAVCGFQPTRNSFVLFRQANTKACSLTYAEYEDERATIVSTGGFDRCTAVFLFHENEIK